MAKLPIPQEIKELSTEDILQSLANAIDNQLNQAYENLAQHEKAFNKQMDKDSKLKP